MSRYSSGTVYEQAKLRKVSSHSPHAERPEGFLEDLVQSIKPSGRC